MRKKAVLHRKRWTPEKIKALRKAFGESRVEFGDRIGATFVTVKAWESAVNYPTGPTCRLFDYLERYELGYQVNDQVLGKM